MAKRNAPFFVKLQKSNTEVEHLLTGVALHFGIRRNEIDLGRTYKAYSHSLKIFKDYHLNHYMQYNQFNPQQIADAFGCSFKFWEFQKDYRIAPQRPKLVREIHSNYNCNGVIHFGVKAQSFDAFIL